MSAGTASTTGKPPAPGPSLQAAIDAFLGRPDLARSTRRSYRLTLTRLAAIVGAEHHLGELPADELERALQDAWTACAPATWNRHLVTLLSFRRYCVEQGWPMAGRALTLRTRREKTNHTRAIPYPQLERLFSRPASRSATARCGGCCTRARGA